MKIIEPGHVYQLEHRDGTGAGLLVFVNREAGTEHEGTQTQEVLRALIDRTKHCDGCLRWEGNDKIIEHLRMALVLHEARALERKVEKGELQPEIVPTGDDGHFKVVTKKYIPGVFSPTPATGMTIGVDMAAPYTEPKTTDYCVECGESPDSAIHVIGRDSHTYVDPRFNARITVSK